MKMLPHFFGGFHFIDVIFYILQARPFCGHDVDPDRGDFHRLSLDPISGQHVRVHSVQPVRRQHLLAGMDQLPGSSLTPGSGVQLIFKHTHLLLQRRKVSQRRPFYHRPVAVQEASGVQP